MPDDRYYILIGDSETGPWSLDQMRAFWKAGAVTLETLYAQPGMSEWKPLATIPDFAAAAAATPQSENPHVAEQRKIIEHIVNMLLPLEADSAAPQTGKKSDQPAEPEEMDMARMREWLHDKLLAMDFCPVTDATSDKFESYLSAFSAEEQKQAFGEGPLKNYRRGDIKAAQLIGSVDNLIALEQFRVMEPWLRHDTAKFRRMGEESGKQAAQKILQRRAQAIKDALGL